MPFGGLITTQWSADGDSMTVVHALAYLDPRGRTWSVPAGFVTDGASIPRFLWSIVGSPFTGEYRKAAVFHDAAYATLGVKKRSADRMFFNAMRESGVRLTKAWALTTAVAVFGHGPHRAAQKRARAAARAGKGMR